MLMKCSKCGYENQLNAIFCRGCGEKIVPEEVTPEALAAEAKKRQKSKRKINWRPAVGLFLLIFVVGYGYLLFSKPSTAPVYQKDTAVKYEGMLKRINSGYTTAVTPEQLTAYFNEYLISKSHHTSNSNYTVKDIVFTGTGDELTITIYTQVMSFDVVLTFTGKPKKGPASDPVQFEITKFRFGQAPLPFCDEMMLAKFDSLFKTKALQDIFTNAESISFKDGKLHVTQKKIWRK